MVASNNVVSLFPPWLITFYSPFTDRLLNSCDALSTSTNIPSTYQSKTESYSRTVLLPDKHCCRRFQGEGGECDHILFRAQSITSLVNSSPSHELQATMSGVPSIRMETDDIVFRYREDAEAGGTLLGRLGRKITQKRFTRSDREVITRYG